MTDPLRLRAALRALEQAVPVQVAGRVTELTGLVLRATAPGARLGELVAIERDGAGPGDLRGPGPGGPPLLAEVVGFRGDEVVLLPLGPVLGVGPESVVRPTGQPFFIRCGPGLLGRVLDAVGEPIDGGPPLPQAPGADVVPWLVDRPAPDPLRRRRVTQPVSFGVRAIDGVLTVGEGQRLGLFAAPGLGKSTLLGQIARNFARNAAAGSGLPLSGEADVIVIGLVGERGREVRDFVEVQLDPETQRRAVVVCATSDQPPLLRLKAATTATAIAEFFRDRGGRVLLLLDSITRVARAGREVGLAAGELPARQGFPPSVFALLPRLMERAGQGETGSITAVYAVLVTGTDDPQEDVIADEVRATLDGHIELSRAMAERGQWPAIDVLRSLSRVMDDIVEPAHRAAAARLRETLAICERQRDLLLLGAYQRGTDPAVDRALQQQPAIEAYLRQTRLERCGLEESRRRLLALALSSAADPAASA